MLIILLTMHIIILNNYTFKLTNNFVYVVLVRNPSIYQFNNIICRIARRAQNREARIKVEHIASLYKSKIKLLTQQLHHHHK